MYVAERFESPRFETSQRDLKPPFLIDVFMVMTTLALVGFSLVMVYSTTGIISQEKFGDPLYYARRQVVAAIVGITAMFIFSRVSTQKLKKISPFLIFFCLILLVGALIPGIGEISGGARRWVRLGFIRFQPGELVKVMYVLFIASYLGRREKELGGFREGIVKPFLILSVNAALFLMQPDFGSALVLAAVTVCMMTAAGVRLRYIAACIGVLLVCGGLLVVISPYRMGRVVSFMSPWADASGKGYQLIQSLIAVGTGQVTGVGLGGSQQKLFFLPAAHTDFIFAVIAEELGFVGCVSLLGLFLMFLWRGLKLAGRLSDDTFSFSLAVGLTCLIVVPALLNMGVVLGLLPTKGMVLPLVGYGGSSLVACLITIGILLSLTRSIQKQAV